MAYVLAVNWRAREGEEENVANLLRTMRPLCQGPGEPGCLVYEVSRSIDDPRDFFLYEVYVDEAAFQAHQETDYFRQNVLTEALPRLESRVRRPYEPLD